MMNEVSEMQQNNGSDAERGTSHDGLAAVAVVVIAALLIALLISQIV